MYNIKNDISQENNLVEKCPKKLNDIKAAYEKRWKYILKDFGHYEAYKIGVPHIKETTLTNHDLHSEVQLAWNQSFIRNSYNSKKPADHKDI